MTRCIRLSITAVAGLVAAGLTVALPAAADEAPRNANETHLVLTGVIEPGVTIDGGEERTRGSTAPLMADVIIENDGFAVPREERSRGSVIFMAAIPPAAEQAGPYDRHMYSDYLG